MFDETGYLVKIGKLYLQMPPKGDERISEYSLVFTSNAYEAIKYKSYEQAKKLADVFGGVVTRLETRETPVNEADEEQDDILENAQVLVDYLNDKHKLNTIVLITASGTKVATIEAHSLP